MRPTQKQSFVVRKGDYVSERNLPCSCSCEPFKLKSFWRSVIHQDLYGTQGLQNPLIQEHAVNRIEETGLTWSVPQVGSFGSPG